MRHPDTGIGRRVGWSEATAPRIIWQFAEAMYCLTRLYENLFPDTELISLKVKLFGDAGTPTHLG